MKKLYFVLCAALMLSFGACQNGEMTQLQKEKDSLQAIVDSKDDEINNLFDMLNQIEDNLAMISDKYSSVKSLKQNSVEGNTQVKGEISTQIANIDEMLATNKKKLAELQSKIGSLGTKNTQLNEFVAKLEERIASQESQISELMAELENNKIIIGNLNRNVSDLTASNQRKDETIAAQTAEANRAYFIVGSYNELKDLGIVSKSGGFIGIGKKQSTTSDMATEHFTMIDRTKVTTITVNKKNAKVVSNHPSNSYELVTDDNDEKVTAYLRILNPTEFWQYTKYLVISTR